jgi:putative membrane protein
MSEKTRKEIDMMGCCGYGWFGTSGWIAGILNLIVIAGVIVGFVVLAIWAIRRAGKSSAGSTANQESETLSPIEIARLRYARGEINREQFQELLSDLK